MLECNSSMQCAPLWNILNIYKEPQEAIRTAKVFESCSGLARRPRVLTDTDWYGVSTFSRGKRYRHSVPTKISRWPIGTGSTSCMHVRRAVFFKKILNQQNEYEILDYDLMFWSPPKHLKFNAIFDFCTCAQKKAHACPSVYVRKWNLDFLRTNVHVRTRSTLNFEFSMQNWFCGSIIVPVSVPKVANLRFRFRK